MLSPFEFGVAIGQQAFHKTAAGAKPGGLFGAALGALSNMGKPAVKATANMGAQLPPPRLPLKPGTTPASLERTTGTILNSAGAPVPRKAPPPPLSPPSKATATRTPSEIARAKELGLNSSDYVDGTQFATPNRVLPQQPAPIGVSRAGRPAPDPRSTKKPLEYDILPDPGVTVNAAGQAMSKGPMSALANLKRRSAGMEPYKTVPTSAIPQTPVRPMPKTPGLITPNPATRKPLGPEGWGRVPAAPKDWGRVPTGPTSAAQAQSFYDDATSGGRQRMLGLDPQARPAPAAAPQSWTQLSPAQQQAVQGFYSGGQGMTKTQSAHEFAAKLAQSTCSPCDMPNGPTNKKHMTGASPAVLEADEKSEELGRPESEETEHSEKAIDIPGKAAALKFGRRLAKAAAIGDMSGALMHSDSPGNQEWDNAISARQNAGLAANLPAPAQQASNQPSALSRILSALGSAGTAVGGALNSTGKTIGEVMGTAGSAPAAAWTGPSSPKPPRSLNDIIAGQVSEHSPPPSELVARMNVDGSNKLNPAPAAAGPGLLSQIAGSPYTPYVAGGLGATGLAALAYHLMNQKPKKKREEDRGEDKE
jgi:hypothetical protein